MAFPSSPSNGDFYQGYVYSSTIGAWNKDKPIERGSNSNGEWVKYESGYIEQWDKKTVNSVNGTYSESITFPVTFSGLPEYVAVSSESASQTGGSLAIMPGNMATTGFGWRKDSTAVASMERYWFARGRYK